MHVLLVKFKKITRFVSRHGQNEINTISNSITYSKNNFMTQTTLIKKFITNSLKNE